MSQVVVKETSPLEALSQPSNDISISVRSGEILVHITKLSVTANTVTYSLVGRHSLKTFEHFPVPNPKYASVPAWGVGVVTSSKNASVPVGTRLQGYYPMRKHVILTPSKVKRKQFEDTASHRAALIPAYRTYRMIQQPATKDQEQMENLLLTDALLFSTGWGCAQQGLEMGGNTILITSASSRTSLTAAFSAQHHKMFQEVIGVTSARNVTFVKSTGLYDTVCTYDDIAGSLGYKDGRKVVVYDMAGNREAKLKIRQHFGEAVVDYASVGQTTVSVNDANPLGRGMPVDANGGAKEKGFLVFHALAAASKKYGQNRMASMLTDAQKAYCVWKLPHFQTMNLYGVEGLLRVWRDTVDNKALAGISYMCSLWETPEDAEPWTFNTGSHL
jgi:hypothetical protein